MDSYFDRCPRDVIQMISAIAIKKVAYMITFEEGEYSDHVYRVIGIFTTIEDSVNTYLEWFRTNGGYRNIFRDGKWDYMIPASLSHRISDKSLTIEEIPLNQNIDSCHDCYGYVRKEDFPGIDLKKVESAVGTPVVRWKYHIVGGHLIRHQGEFYYAPDRRGFGYASEVKAIQKDDYEGVIAGRYDNIAKDQHSYPYFKADPAFKWNPTPEFIAFDFAK